MKKIFFLAVILGMAAPALHAQKYFTRDGKINFVASTPLETIDATSKGTTAVIDASSGALEFAVLVKGFIFEKALMQEHFNENYIESEKYPKATFKGRIVESTAVNWTKDGTYKVNVQGKLNIHGVEKERTIPAVITVKSGKIMASSSFDVAVADHEIKIPSVVQDKIARIAKVQVDVTLAEMKN